MKFKALWLSLAILLSVNNSFSQEQDPVLFTIDNKPVYTSEFVRITTKNLQQQDDKPNLQESLDIFINFKLKVKAAEEEGIDTTKVFIRDIAQYRRQLAKPYLQDQKVTEDLLDEAWKRSQEEFRASHILVGVVRDAPPGDTLRAYQRAAKIKERLDAGEDFAQLAMEISDDPSAKTNGGDLGFHAVFDFIYLFENAVFNTPVGGISEPFRTEFGYHIITVAERIPTRGQIKIAVILKSSMYGMSEEEHAIIKSEIDEIYKKLVSGEKFEDLAMKYSDDKNSGSRGGQLPWFGVGNKPQDFQEAAFSIKNIGDYSEPVLTQMGWYIFKLLEHKIPVREKMTTIFERKIARDADRSAKSKSVITERLKEEYNFKVNQNNYEEFYRLVDPSIFGARWDPNPALQKNDILFSLDGKNFPQSDFAKYLALNMRETREVPIAEYLDKQFSEFIETTILTYEETQLEKKYPEFRNLFLEFRDGNLLFEVMDKRVWTKASKDTVGLQDFYKSNKANYMWGERLNGTIIYCKAESDLDIMAEEMHKAVKKYSKTDTSAKPLEEVLGEVAEKYSGSFELSSGPFSKNENPISDNVKWKKGVSDLMKDDNSRIFVWTRSILESMPKTIREARGQITADYQDFLDKEWIKELRQKHSVVIDENVLQNIKL